MTNENKEPILHVVRDGDSLAKLAQRYLGDASRAREIYELNRDLVAHPDLLKIGVQLRIPQSGPQIHAESPKSAEADGSLSRKLVPLPPLPTNRQVAPRARLLSPIPATMAGG